MIDATDDKKILKALQSIPNVGPAFAKDLLLLNIKSVDQLKQKNPQELYEKLEQVTNKRQDPCVLDTFMAVVHFAEKGESIPWWHFTPQRKALELERNSKKRP